MNEKSTPDTYWDIIVDAAKSGMHFNGKNIWKYRDLILLFAKRDISTVYNQTILGPLWFFIQPLLTSILLKVIFSGIAGIKTDPVPGMLFYLSGLTVWSYFATCLTNTSNTFIANAAIFGKVYFPRIVTPLSKMVSGLFVFCVQFILFLLFLFYWVIFKGMPLHLSWYMLFIPYIILVSGATGIGIGIIVSAFTTKYRDLYFLVTFSISLLMFATPIILPLTMVHGKFRIIFLANPISSLIEAFRYSFFPAGDFQWIHLAYSSVFMLLLIISGILIFNRTERNFMDTI